MSDNLYKNYIKKLDNLTCDYIVVGSGAGGSVAAYELSKQKKDVILIEEGETENKQSASLRTSTRALRILRSALQPLPKVHAGETWAGRAALGAARGALSQAFTQPLPPLTSSP